jgi:hypothetical protein
MTTERPRLRRRGFGGVAGVGLVVAEDMVVSVELDRRMPYCNLGRSAL